MPDPFAELGVAPDADEAALRAARRRLAKSLHPDHSGGDAARMQRLNAAFDEALELIQHRADEPPPATAAPPPPRMPGRMAHDVASFTIEALPAEAFEALLVVGAWLGEVINDDPPYQLDVELGEPFACWCRLDLVPDAGASTVAITLVATDGATVTSSAPPTLPDLDAVRDAWVTNLNTLGRPE